LKEADLETGQWVIIILSVLLGVWYVGASIYNRKRGVATYEWLRAGLETLGKVTEAKWIGGAGTGARLVVGQAEYPFRRVEVVFLLNSREILPLWLFNLLRGKDDEMILKATLRRVPTPLEVGRAGDRDLKKLAAAGGQKGFQQIRMGTDFETVFTAQPPESVRANLEAFLAQFAAEVLRISQQRETPHLIFRARLPGLRAQPAAGVFTVLGQWVKGEMISGSPKGPAPDAPPETPPEAATRSTP